MPKPAAFGRLCVETSVRHGLSDCYQAQPPSGGCVLKHAGDFGFCGFQRPAAFGRLCVETNPQRTIPYSSIPAAFGRLCVETEYQKLAFLALTLQPPSGGCVLKRRSQERQNCLNVPAAFGRLCVETT